MTKSFFSRGVMMKSQSRRSRGSKFKQLDIFSVLVCMKWNKHNLHSGTPLVQTHQKQPTLQLPESPALPSVKLCLGLDFMNGLLVTTGCQSRGLMSQAI